MILVAEEDYRRLVVAVSVDVTILGLGLLQVDSGYSLRSIQTAALQAISERASGVVYGSELLQLFDVCIGKVWLIKAFIRDLMY